MAGEIWLMDVFDSWPIWGWDARSYQVATSSGVGGWRTEHESSKTFSFAATEFCWIADAVAKRYRPWPKGLRADSLPWFDPPLVQGASRLRYTDKAQIAATGPYWPKGARKKKKSNRVLLDTTELRAWSEIRLHTGVFMKEMVLNFWDSSEGSFLCSVAQRRCTTESNACSSGQSRQRDKRSSMFWERLDQRLKASTGCLRALWWETWSKIFAFQRVISSCCIFEIFLRRWGNGFNFILAPSMWCSFGMLSINTLSARVFTEIWRG